jgi:RNA polymerase sporulation-specific sigma factor
MHYVMNDYELLYLVHFEKDDNAFLYLFKKYHRFIWKQVHIMNLKSIDHDDFYQEGLLMLNKAIQTFDEEKNKSFTRYFELILKRHFYYLKRNLPTYMLCEDTNFVKGASYIEEELDLSFLNTEIEKDIFQLYFIEEIKIKDILEKYPYTRKQIYNTIYRIKEKYKIMI